ncbi:S-layer homology domain-containing protein [Cohnella sp. JJ-181]|uniref:S-layer homology domain-containing protein n=1 Tax=Cohnella rhizoplanae TaxID=2974897 RepID=UPI0022FF5851|nr:S-layer homology domain-containing protein [Cohnella sp. JJ-181]CAI6065893.1 hypothetical protein COHCIP112018_02080 [Cohnella sp. JJ-181]
MAWGQGVRFAACAVALSMIGTGWGGAVSAAAPEEHWAQETLNAWVGKGWLAGGNGGELQPDQPVTRAEFATLAVRAFGLQAGDATANFSDVRDGSWYAGAIDAAAEAGILTGYPDGTIRPTRSVTREEAAVMLAKLNGLTEAGGAESSFSDAVELRSWSKPSVGAAVYSKLLGGYPDGTFRPARAMTRAEAVVALDKAWALHERSRTTVYDKAGIYGPAEGTQEIAGSVVIKAPGVTLRNTAVRGDLTIGAEVGEGDATLEGVTVGGTLTLAGGGERSVHLSNAVLGQVVVNKPGGKLRLVLEGTTNIAKLEFRTVGLLIVPSGSSVGSLFAYAIIQVTGTGKIALARLYVSGSSFEQAPGSLEREAGVLLAGESASGGSSSGGSATPTPAPSVTPSPSSTPSAEPSASPSPSPSPSAEPSPSPSTEPSPSPSTEPSPSPSTEPSPSPSTEPSPSPSAEPSPTPGPAIIGVDDGQVYTAAVTPELGEGETAESYSLTKDGVPVVGYQFGDELSETGVYVLVATNNEGGETSIQFTLSADVSLSTNFRQYYKFDGELRVQVHVENTGLDLYNAVNGIELTLPNYDGDTVEVYYWYGPVNDWFELERVEGTDRFIGHYPEEPYSLPHEAAFDITYSVDIGTSTIDRDLKLKAWVADASAPEEEDALFELVPEDIHVAYDSLGQIDDLAIDPTGDNDETQVHLTFTEPLDSNQLWVYVIKGNNVTRWSDGNLEWGEGRVWVKNLAAGVDYQLQLIVIGGYNKGESNAVDYSTLAPPPPPPLPPSE